MTDPVPIPEIAEHNNELFRNLLIPEIFSKILRYLKPKDRLNMRVCCRDTEEAVARSDMHIQGSPQYIYLSSVSQQFKLLLGLKKDRTTLMLIEDIFDNNLEEIARVKERLFTRVFTRFVDVDVNFDLVHFELVARLLEGCIFEELDLTISNSMKEDDFGVLKYLCNLDLNTSRKIKVSLYILEELVIELCKRRHESLALNSVVIKEQAISDIVKIVEDNPDRQSVKINVFAETTERFVLTTDFRLIKDRGERDRYANIIKQRRKEDNEKEDEVVWRVRKILVRDYWNGSFELTTGRVHVYAHYFVSTFKFVICNFPDPEEVQSDDDDGTVYLTV